MDRQVLVIQQRETQTEKKVDYYSFKPLMQQLEIARLPGGRAPILPLVRRRKAGGQTPGHRAPAAGAGGLRTSSKPVRRLAHFTLFSRADSRPEKTHLSHVLTGLNAIKLVAK